MIEYQGIKGAVMDRTQPLNIRGVDIPRVRIDMMPTNSYPVTAFDFARLTVERICPLSGLVHFPSGPLVHIVLM